MDASAQTARRIQADPQQWADDVLGALLHQLANPARQLSTTRGRITVERSWTDVHDGHPVLHVVYRHPWWDFLTGLRRHLDEVDRYPLSLPTPDVDPVADLADDLADDIATSDIEEPLRAVAESMAPDDEGVWWWGHPPLPADESRRGPAPGGLS